MGWVGGGVEGEDDHTLLRNQQVVNLYSGFWDSGIISICCLSSHHIVGAFTRRVATSVRPSGRPHETTQPQPDVFS